MVELLTVIRKIGKRLQLVSQRKIALQVAEKVEAASTFRNATRQVAACDTPTATCIEKLLCKLQGQIASCDMALSGQPKWYNNGLRMQEKSL